MTQTVRSWKYMARATSPEPNHSNYTRLVEGEVYMVRVYHTGSKFVFVEGKFASRDGAFAIMERLVSVKHCKDYLIPFNK